MTNKSSPKPAEAIPKNPDCPHKAIAHMGGGNWGTAYYDSEEKANEVSAWIKAGHNPKWNCGGRTDGVEQHDYKGIVLWSIHHHYDNTRSPSWSDPIPEHEQYMTGKSSRHLNTYLAWRRSKLV
jgi:hypothetical protein